MIRHFTASGVVINSGRVLLVRHAALGTWLFPGGHLEADEDPAQALHREIREEVGLEIEIISAPRRRHPGVATLAAPFTILVEDIPGASAHQHIDMVYVCQARHDSVIIQPAELSAYQWARPDEVASFPSPPQIPGVAADAYAYACENGLVSDEGRR